LAPQIVRLGALDSDPAQETCLPDALVRAVYDLMPYGVLLFSRSGRITEANIAAQRILGRQKAELIGLSGAAAWHSVDEHGGELPRSEHPACVVLRTGQPVRNFTMGAHRPDGSRAWLRIDAFPVERTAGQVSGVACFLADVTDRTQLEEALRQQALDSARLLQRLEAHRSIDMAIAASLDLRLTLGVIADRVTRLLGVSAASIHVFNSATNGFAYAAGSGLRKAALAHSPLLVGVGHVRRAALEHHTIHLDVERAPDLLPAGLAEAKDFKAYMAVPLIARLNLRGVLEIFHSGELDAQPEWVEFVETLAGQAAIAIDNAALFEEQQRASGPARPFPTLQVESAPNLNRAEAAVLRLLALGESNRGIAAKLDMSENTIKFHIHGLFRKLKVRSRVAAAVVATSRGWF
jgi:PAS domain S-box-containing protein